MSIVVSSQAHDPTNWPPRRPEQSLWSRRAAAIASSALVASFLVGAGAGVASSTSTDPTGSLLSGTGGTTSAWGRNDNAQTTVPSSLTGKTVAIAGGDGHSLALTTDGTVIAWGSDSWRQSTVPPSLDGKTTAIAAGAVHSLALTTDGTVIAWGSDSWRQSTVPPSLDGKTAAIAAGAFHSLALTNDGAITAWGDDSYGQTTVPSFLSDKTVTAIAAGRYFSLALTDDGTITAWGRSNGGQTAVPPALTGKSAAIAAGDSHGLALTNDGTVTAWGYNGQGQTTVPPSLTGETVTAIAAGGFHSLALTTEGTITAWGDDTYGQTTVPPSLRGKTVTAIAAGYYHSLAVTTLPSPVVSSIWPATGRTNGGNHPKIIGSGFTGTTSITIGGVEVPEFTVVSDTELNVTTPPGPLGTAEVVLTTPGGTTTVPGGFTYTEAPTVTALSPTTGPTAGGTTVQVTGTDLIGTYKVFLGNTPVTDFTVVDDTHLTLTTPPRPAGVTNLRVWTPSAPSPAAPGNRFEYKAPPAPAITDITPDRGTMAGGKVITVTGTGFTGTTAVKLAKTGPSATFTVESDTTLQVTTPASNNAGPTYVRITTPRGTNPQSNSAIYTYTR